MSLTDALLTIETAVTNDVFAKSFKYGRLSDANLLASMEFPVCLVVADEGTEDIPNSRSNYDVMIYVIDKFNKQDKDVLTRQAKFDEVKASALRIWIAGLPTPDNIYNKSNLTFDLNDNAFNGLYSMCMYRANVGISNCG